MRHGATPYRALLPALLLAGTLVGLMGLLGCSVGGTTHGEAPEDPAAGIEQTGEGIVAPQVTDDADTPTGTRTQWACVTFGSYPQTEIVRGSFDAVDAYA